MICKICGVNETANPDGICDDCKFCILITRILHLVFRIFYPLQFNIWYPKVYEISVVLKLHF